MPPRGPSHTLPSLVVKTLSTSSPTHGSLKRPYAACGGKPNPPTHGTSTLSPEEKAQSVLLQQRHSSFWRAVWFYYSGSILHRLQRKRCVLFAHAAAKKRRRERPPGSRSGARSPFRRSGRSNPCWRYTHASQYITHACRCSVINCVFYSRNTKVSVLLLLGGDKPTHSGFLVEYSLLLPLSQHLPRSTRMECRRRE